MYTWENESIPGSADEERSEEDTPPETISESHRSLSLSLSQCLVGCVSKEY